MIKTYINRELYNAISCIGYKLSFYKHYGLYLTSSVISPVSVFECLIVTDEKYL